MNRIAAVGELFKRIRVMDRPGQGTDAAEDLWVRRFLPLYRKLGPITGRIRQRLVQEALAKASAPEEWLPLELSRGLPDTLAALRLLVECPAMEESFVACDWSYRVYKTFEPADFGVLERWVNKYVGNWASCDTLCNHTVGAFVEMYPEYLRGL